MNAYKIIPKGIRERIIETSLFKAYLKKKDRKMLNLISNGMYSKEFPEESSFMVKHNRLDIYPYEWSIKYTERTLNINPVWDLAWGGYYYVYEGKKLYFPKSYPVERIEACFYELLKEQDLNCAHRYFNDVKIENCTFVDCGAAEGMMSLHCIDDVTQVILVEANVEWIEALNKTFEPYRNKVTIIKKFCSDINDSGNVTLDKITENISNPVVVKADVEGMEMKVLSGGKSLLSRSDTQLLVCLYHHDWDEKEIVFYLNEKGYTTKINDGYIFYYFDHSVWPSTFRHGICYAYKEVPK